MTADLAQERIAPLRSRVIGQCLVRLVAFVVVLAGVAKVVDAFAAEAATLGYDPVVLVGLGAAEIALGAWAMCRPGRRLPALAVVLLLLAVTGYLLAVPPGEFETVGCQCFGTRFRFQDIRSHLRFNGVLIVLAAAGAWLSAFRPAGEDF